MFIYLEKGKDITYFLDAAVSKLEAPGTKGWKKTLAASKKKNASKENKNDVRIRVGGFLTIEEKMFDEVTCGFRQPPNHLHSAHCRPAGFEIAWSRIRKAEICHIMTETLLPFLKLTAKRT